MNKVVLRKRGDYIYLVISVGRNRILVSSGISIPDKWWDYDFESKNHPQYLTIARKLEECIRVMGGVINFLPKFATPQEVKAKYLEVIQDRENEERNSLNIQNIQSCLLNDFKAFIERREPLYRLSTIKKYGTCLNVLIDFEASENITLSIENFDKSIFEKFVSFLILKRNYLNNTVAKQVNVLKAFIRDTYPDFNSSFILFREYRPEVIALSEKEFVSLSKLDLTGPKAIARDWFLFLCLTGMSISDVRRFNPGWIVDGFIEYSATKT